MNQAFKVVAVIITALAGFGLHSWVTSSESTVDLAKHCMLSSRACEQDNVSMLIDTDTVHALAPTTVSVTWPNTQADQLVMRLRGLEMSMGEPMFILEKRGDDRFVGEMVLPTCHSGAMTWVGTLSDGKQKVYTAVRTVK